MLKINYPDDKAKKSALEKAYIAKVSNADLMSALATFFKKTKFKKFQKYSLSYILTAPFEKLYSISNSLKLTKKEAENLKKILNYDKAGSGYKPKRQRVISDFFMEKSAEMGISTCYFCNIDYINSFDNIANYESNIDFVNRAKKTELESIKDINATASALIIKSRKKNPITSINSLSLKPKQKNSLTKMLVDEKSNHFTLDHVLKKADHPLLALSLYNLVPSCYSCNSKFKGRINIINKPSQGYLSPTSGKFTFNDDVLFKLFFPTDLKKTYTDVRTIDDFVLDFDISKNVSDYDSYINAFRIRARYAFHKKEVLKLIDKKKRYSKTQIEEIAKIAKVSIERVKQDLFGEELFSKNTEASPLLKLRKDIAKSIGIKGVK